MLSDGGCRLQQTKNGGTKTLPTRVPCIVKGWGSVCIIARVKRMGDVCRNCGGGVKMDRPGRSYAVLKDGVIIR